MDKGNNAMQCYILMFNDVIYGKQCQRNSKHYCTRLQLVDYIHGNRLVKQFLAVSAAGVSKRGRPIRGTVIRTSGHLCGNALQCSGHYRACEHRVSK